MAGVPSVEGSVLGQDCVAAGTLAGRLRTEECRTAEDQLVAEVTYELEERRAEEQGLAAGVHKVVVDIGALDIGVGSRCELVEAVETAVAGIVALAGLAEIADIVVLSASHVELADTAASIGLAAVADNDVLGIADCADTVAQDSLVIVAETGIAVLDSVGSADIAGVAGTVGLVHTVEVVGNAGVVAGTADVVATTEWQPYSTVVTPTPYFYRRQIEKDSASDHNDVHQD